MEVKRHQRRHVYKEIRPTKVEKNQETRLVALQGESR